MVGGTISGLILAFKTKVALITFAPEISLMKGSVSLSDHIPFCAQGGIEPSCSAYSWSS